HPSTEARGQGVVRNAVGPRAESLRPWPVGGCALGLATASPEDASARQCAETLLDEPGLSDTRLARHEHHAAPAAVGGVEARAEGAELDAAADKATRLLDAGAPKHVARCRGSPAGASTASRAEAGRRGSSVRHGGRATPTPG